MASKGGPFPPLASFLCMWRHGSGCLSSPFPFFSFLFLFFIRRSCSRVAWGLAGWFLLFFSSSLLSSSHPMHSRSCLELVRLEFDLSSLGTQFLMAFAFHLSHPLQLVMKVTSSSLPVACRFDAFWFLCALLEFLGFLSLHWMGRGAGVRASFLSASFLGNSHAII